jgi:hypothetical protein
VVLKPPSITSAGQSGKVYALSAVPSFADGGSRTRLVKSEYVFMPYRPSHAVLASGSITVQGSATVDEAAGVPPGRLLSTRTPL